MVQRIWASQTQFSVIIHYADADEIARPAHVMDAYSVTESPKGNLLIWGKKEDRVFARGCWAGSEMQPLK